MKSKLLFAVALIYLLIGCDPLMPGGLWDGFEEDLRVHKLSDQGPWGGKRAYHWKSTSRAYFNYKKMIGYTSSNGWQLVDSTKFRNSTNRINSEQVFRATVGPFEPTSNTNSIEIEFPQWIKGNFTAYRFKSGWLTVYPGTDNSTEINGFVLISEDGKEMSAYHTWGE